MLSKPMYNMLYEIECWPVAFGRSIKGSIFDYHKKELKEIEFYYPSSAATFWALMRRGYINVVLVGTGFVLKPTPAGRAALEAEGGR